MKRYCLIITVDPRAVLSSKQSGTDLLSALLFALQRDNGPGYELKSKTFNTLTVTAKSGMKPDKDAEEKAILDKMNELGLRQTTVSVSLSEEDPEENPEKGKETELNGKTKEKDGVGAYDEIVSMVGIDEIKAWAKGIGEIPEECNSDALLSALTGMTYLLAIDPGNGCTTILEAMGRLMGEKLKINGCGVSEFRLTSENLKEDAASVLGACAIRFDKDLRLYAIHIEDVFQTLHSEILVSFLRELRKRRGRSFLVFVVPYLEESVLQRVRADLDDIASCTLLRVRPYSEEDMIALFERSFSEYGMTVSSDAHGLLLQKIAVEKSDGRFYGIDTVKKICEEILYRKALFGTSADVVTAQDAEAVLPRVQKDDKTGLEQLDGLAALEDVKRKVKEICSAIRLEKRSGAIGKRSMHMVFTGAPGTGKTVVARIVGRILKDSGVLKRGEFYEVSRRDLVGKYVGQTAPKTTEVCRMAYDSVLFIDEAYSLAAGEGGGNDFGREAISTLIAEMENNRDRLIVILAGYKDEIDKLFDLNAGLRDRIPYRMHFPNYSRKELEEIFFLMLPEKIGYDDAFKSRVGEYFSSLPDSVMKDPNFSNARFVRNLVERVISKAALRCSPEPLEDGLSLVESDFVLASSDAEFGELSQKKRAAKIGF